MNPESCSFLSFMIFKGGVRDSDKKRGRGNKEEEEICQKIYNTIFLYLI